MERREETVVRHELKGHTSPNEASTELGDAVVRQAEATPARMETS